MGRNNFSHEKLSSESAQSLLGDDERDRLIRSGLISSQMMGFALMRYVWKIDPVASMSDEEAIAAIAPNLQHYVNGNLAG